MFKCSCCLFEKAMLLLKTMGRFFVYRKCRRVCHVLWSKICSKSLVVVGWGVVSWSKMLRN
jgi:hypothetical protein